jgi:glycosyltransferase involved in cell wall biosynthesis
VEVVVNAAFQPRTPGRPPGQGRVVVIMPARNSALTLEATVRGIPPGLVDQIVLVDNASKDDTVAIAERLGLTVVRHPLDRGFGGSVKRLFHEALAAGADFVIELHPDNQYDPAGIPALLAEMGDHRHAMVIASRFLPARRALDGGMPWWKFVANRFLTFMNNAMMGVWLSEYHSGFRIYSARWARTAPWQSFSDDFKLGFQLISQAVIEGHTLGEVPGFCRYFAEASQNPFLGSVKYGWGTLTESFRVLKYRLGITSARTIKD